MPALNKPQTLQDVLRALPAHAERPAIRAPGRSGRAQWSYAELHEHARRLGAGLIEAGIKPGNSVALLAGARPEWFVACLGVITAGAVIVPLDEQLADEPLRHVLDDSDSRFVFTTQEGWERLERLGVKLTIVLLDDCDEARGWRRLMTDGAALPEATPDHTAALFYTSGTTGNPKGVPLTHANLVFQIRAITAAELVSTRDRLLLPLPLHHVYPFVIGFLLPLALGLPVIIPQALTGPRIVEAIRGERVTAVVGVPRLYSTLYSGIEAQARAKGRVAGVVFAASIGLSTWLRRRFGLRAGRVLLRPLHRRFGSSLRILACGGSALDPELGFKLEGLGWNLAIGYGLTETAPLLTIDPPGKVRMGSVGLPVPEVELRIDGGASPQESAHAEPNKPGEILARGPNVFSGYRNLPEQTAKAFTPDGFFRTGDLGYFDRDGYLYVTGRVSTLIVTAGGENVQPDEIEAIYTAQGAIREIGVLQQGERLVALIVPEQDMANADDTDASVRAAVERGSKRLASYKRISHYAMTREALPRTRLGKIQRHLLKTRYEAALKEKSGAAVAGPLALEEMSDQDQALLENATARRVWDWLAARYPEVRFTPDSHLQLDLGLDSLSWLNLTMEVGSRFGLELSEDAAARMETVRDLLGEVSGETGPVRRLDQNAALKDPEQVLTEAQRRWLVPHSRWESFIASGFYHLNRALMRGLFRVRTRGLEHLPAQGAFVLAPNHVSYLDPFAVVAALTLEQMLKTYWGGWVSVAFSSRFKRVFSRIAHVLPIEPQRAAMSSLAFGAAVLKRGRNLAWFPEGQRSTHGELLPFKPGLGMLLEQLRVPVVPVYIAGSFGALPRGRWRPRFVTITVVFGEPCDPTELLEIGQGEQPYERIVSALRDRVAALKSTS